MSTATGRNCSASSPRQVFEALGTYLGSTYVNDFNLLGRTFRVTAQAEPTARDDLADIGRLQVRSATGAMVPLVVGRDLPQRQRAGAGGALQPVPGGRAAGAGRAGRFLRRRA